MTVYVYTKRMSSRGFDCNCSSSAHPLLVGGGRGAAKIKAFFCELSSVIASFHAGTSAEASKRKFCINVYVRSAHTQPLFFHL